MCRVLQLDEVISAVYPFTLLSIYFLLSALIIILSKMLFNLINDLIKWGISIKVWSVCETQKQK